MRAELGRVLTEYPTARLEPLTDHPLAAHIGHDLADEVRERVGSDSHKVTGSPGRGNWAETPWVAVFDRLVTETAQRGFYVAYLFRNDGTAVHLSLNQGTTEVMDLVGRSAYLGELETRASSLRALVGGNDLSGLDFGPIDLGGSGALTRGYGAGNILAVRYGAGDLPPDETLEADLDRFLDLYAALVQSRDALVEDADPAAVESATAAGMEAAKERWHKRSERNPSLARAAKRHHGTTCAVCGFNFEETYGELGAGFIEAHHLTPFAQLQGRPTQLNPATDFAVVCPNCHRMLHRQTPPLTPHDLRSRMEYPSG